MRAVRAGKEGIFVADVPTADGPGARVQVTSAGICGSDLHAYATGAISVTLGHEFGGYLDDGTLVAVQPNVPCGQCSFCVRGADQLCSQGRSSYYGATLDGGLAEQVVVDRGSLVAVPPGVSADAVALVEPMAVAVHAVNRGACVAKTLVIGGGTVGLLCAAVLHERGVEVTVAARHPRQREIALALGASVEVEGRFEAVIDAAGSAFSFDQAVRTAERGGRIVLVALPWEPVTIPMRLVMNEVTVIPAVYYGHHAGLREFEDAAAIMARNRHVPDLLITHRFSLSHAAKAFAVAADRAGGAVKVVLHP